MEKQNPLAYGLNGSGAEELKNCFFTNSTSWDFNPMDQNDPFESALSSMVSSPVASSGGGPGGGGGGGGGGENIMLKELIGRLGSICNSGDISSPHSYIGGNGNGNGNGNTSTNTTCYNTPMNSPPKLNLSVMDHKMRRNFPISGSHFSAKSSLIAPFPSDLGFAERIPEFGQRLSPNLASSCKNISGSSTSNCSKNISGSQINVQENGYTCLKPDFPVPDKKITKFSRPSTPENSGFGDSVEISSLTEQQITVVGQNNNTMNRLNESNPRKRKSASKGKAKEPTSSKEANLQVAAESTDIIDTKRSKSEEENLEDTKLKEKSKGTNKKQSKDDDNNEPPKDYIHVRARRGQATDAHSLAERVRREKIGERMKMLQNLVPGCNMVTGKAVMLDEIINYVQSLQHQVEFLSMKLATINPISDLNVESSSSHLSKDVISSSNQGNLQHNLYHQSTEFPHTTFYPNPPQGPSMPNGVDFHYAMNHLNGGGSSGQNMIIQMPPASDNYGEVPSQVPAFWGNDLHTVVQMGLGQNQTQNLQGSGFMSTDQMKVEQ